MPRVLGVNHHPEIVNRQRQIIVLKRKLERGDVTPEWFDERMRTLTEPIEDEFGDRLLHLTSSYTLMAPLRFSLYRAVQERADALGVAACGSTRRTCRSPTASRRHVDVRPTACDAP